MTVSLTNLDIKALNTLRYRPDGAAIFAYGPCFCTFTRLTAPRFRVLAGLGLINVVDRVITISPAGVEFLKGYEAGREAQASG